VAAPDEGCSVPTAAAPPPAAPESPRVALLNSIAIGLNPALLELQGAGDILADAEIDGIEIPKTPAAPAAPLCKDGAATPMPAARIAVSAAITALFCMVAAVFWSVDTRTGVLLAALEHTSEPALPIRAVDDRMEDVRRHAA